MRYAMATAVAMVVSLWGVGQVVADDGTYHTELFLLPGGQLNGQPIDATHDTITVAAGQSLNGTVNVRMLSTHGSNAVVPIAGTTTWGERETAGWTVVSHVNPGWHDLAIAIDQAAPTKPGIYYILIASRGEFNWQQIVSATNWSYSGGVTWHDGNDVGWDWGDQQYQETRAQGWTTWPVLGNGGFWDNVQGATWVQVRVRGDWSRLNANWENTRCYATPGAARSTLQFDEKCSCPGTSVVASDVNGDGAFEVAVATNNALAVHRADGTVLWSVTEPALPSGIAMDDVNGDARPDVLISGAFATGAYEVRAYRGYDGQLLQTISIDVTSDESATMRGVYDLNGDGNLEVVTVRNSGYSQLRRGLWVYDYNTASELWHYEIGPGADGGVVVADVNGDGALELLMGGSAVHNGKCANGYCDTAGSWLFCFNATGQSLWATQLGNWTVKCSVADIDGDGVAEIIAFCGGDFYGGYRGAYKIRGTDGAILQSWISSAHKGAEGRAIGDLRPEPGLEIATCFTWPTQGTDELDLLGADFQLLASRPLGASYNYVRAIADLNGDGANELYVNEGPTLWAFDGDLNPLWSQAFAHNVEEAIIADLEGNGRLSLLVAEGGTLHVLAPQPILPGDLNCDGAVNGFDIDPFVLALTFPAYYATVYPDCNINLGDIDGDGQLDAFDIDPFVECVVHNGCR
jgi:hypothetical protein